MSKLMVVGHYSTTLLVAWVVWAAWVAWQVRWFRRLRAEEPSVADSPVEDAARPAIAVEAPEPPPETPSVVLRAPGAALRTMSPASAPKPEAAPEDGPRKDTPPSVEDASVPPPADHEAAERPEDVKPFE